MDFELILKNIKKHIALNEAEKRYFTSQLRERSIAKKEMLLEQGNSCRNIYFIRSGSLRAFYPTQEGKESTIMFGIADWWITDMYCFINQKPALLNIEALEDSRLWSLDYNRLQNLFIEIPKFERFFRILMQNAYCREQLRALDNITFSGAERYTRFVEKYPLISEKITQKDLASYLGITPEFLSSFKRKKEAT
ncbi:Crp/Fnr family transcriptional regulator [Poritiphilus flavus]|uniref:Cyclic nucleotide-binding domain-containing protein n=1 Tax=Poritiphilus flavus TaxID=2697053 RepID=A0A6L9E8S4_9FLAO|nr:Crp/Fnr family transcriptional regulator [Poritiphilus flavus]NAS11140.1 cyclic nucleotide-binding domain-containing protein [Poritiphilus flavus]